MAKKMFPNRERGIPNTQVPSVSRQDPESDIANASRDSPLSGMPEQLPL